MHCESRRKALVEPDILSILSYPSSNGKKRVSFSKKRTADDAFLHRDNVVRVFDIGDEAAVRGTDKLDAAVEHIDFGMGLKVLPALCQVIGLVFIVGIEIADGVGFGMMEAEIPARALAAMVD